MITTPIASITKQDIEGLVTNKVIESRYIEYKRDLPTSKGDSDFKCLAEICAFANTDGGHILFGVPEHQGVPIPPLGLGSIDVDQEKERLKNLIRDRIVPRLASPEMKVIWDLQNGPVLVLHIPRSWSAPHMVTGKKLSFYVRTSSGKDPMDYRQLNDAFLVRGETSRRLRQFRDERAASLLGSNIQSPIALPSEPLALLIIYPLSACSETSFINMQNFSPRDVRLPPLGFDGGDRRYNIDGYLVYYQGRGGQQLRSGYCQLHRSGVIESASSAVFVDTQHGRMLSIPLFERYTVEAVKQYLASLEALEVQLPAFVMGAIVGAKGMGRAGGYRDDHPIDRDIVTLPDVIVEDFSCDVPRTLRPLFDGVCNACGLPGSTSYNEEGEWQARM
ncbi:hypothetical protein LCGC14_0226100 [marine sediment metagenome]|uniref:Schlafen AlbA-2 domain-containing protein n=1 Tax=marine sediment metagenome TaxID=412755 RepID=A0A0F9UT31_9ZZZZ|nr:ATP-binding protein [Phycisphaerae bacterium]HDZ42937.1 ATP-binding protein [Phycisphaerae bacterium]